MLLHDERVLVSARAKAEAFVSVYEKVNRMEMSRGCRMKKRLNACLTAGGPEQQDSDPISLMKMRTALTAMDGGRLEGVVRKAKRGVKVLRRLCGRDWGWSKSFL